MLIPLPLLLAGLGLIPAARTTAQTLTVVYRFTDGHDGANPNGTLLLSGNTFYGTSQYGGDANDGSLFAVNTDGTGVATVHGFTATDYTTGINSDGGSPSGSLVLSGGTLYGTASSGGSAGNGLVFAVNIDGTDFTILHSFTDTNPNNADGSLPFSGLILSGNTLYGTAAVGGSAGNGAVFAVNTDGTGFTNLHSFSADNASGHNNDGAHPFAGLILSGNTLYGTTSMAGPSGKGTVFALNANGSNFTTLHHFAATSGAASANSDGALPGNGPLILSGGTLYGTATSGGTSGSGTVFALNTNGSNFTTLHSFTAYSYPAQTNRDGYSPNAGLILSGGTLYGTAEDGGHGGSGTVFAVNTNGTAFTVLYHFTAINPNTGTNTDGANPAATLALSGNILYGTTTAGGKAAPGLSSSFGNVGSGTVFALTLPSVSGPQLAITPAGTNVILTWTNTAVGFTLEATTDPAPPAVWTTVSATPVAVSGQFTVTNTVSDSATFYRLSR